ncbi:hypothetical protein [Methylobacterium sp.]|uniref:hypothetical protein n=1 Tax=Methylobacterium sp. TaxID=409 RepID=UPI003B021B03
MKPADLAVAGRLLTGEDQWKRAFARLLGERHPEGPRESMDPRAVDRWVNGVKEMPDWVAPVVVRLLTTLAEDAERDARDARALLRVLS